MSSSKLKLLKLLSKNWYMFGDLKSVFILFCSKIWYLWIKALGRIFCVLIFAVLISSLYSSGLDYVAHEDVLPYYTPDSAPIQHELFDKFLMHDSQRSTSGKRIFHKFTELFTLLLFMFTQRPRSYFPQRIIIISSSDNS